MTSPAPIELALQHVVSQWEDIHQNKRSHIVLVLPSGVSAKHLLPCRLVDNNSSLVGEIQWVNDSSSVRRILTHSRYNEHYHAGHPKWIALQGALDKARGNKSSFRSNFKIKLPSSGYQFTSKEISGHDTCQVFEHACFKTDEHGNRVEVQAKATLFCLFDLVIPSETQQVGNAPILEDDFEIDY
jgi:hypothetical protein